MIKFWIKENWEEYSILEGIYYRKWYIGKGRGLEKYIAEFKGKMSVEIRWQERVGKR